MQKNTQAIDLKILELLVPINSLGADALNDLVKHAKIKQLPAGAVVFRAGKSDNWVVYLLEGDLELNDPKGGSRILQAGSKRSQVPVSPQQPRRADCTAATDVTVMQVDESLLEVLLGFDSISDLEVNELTENDDTLENRVLHGILQSFHNGTLILPTSYWPARHPTSAAT